MTPAILKIFHPEIPAELRLKNEPTGTCILRLFAVAVERGLQPAGLPKVGLKNVTGRISSVQEEVLSELRGKHNNLVDISDGRAIGMMAQAYIDYWKKRQGHGDLEESSTGGIQWRPEQIAYHKPVSEGLKEKKIVLGEGATGIGKGLVMARLALEAFGDGRGPVVICSPSVATLIQNFSEWQALSKFHKTTPLAGVVMGRQCFVDIDALTEILHDKELLPETKSAARRWIETGAGVANGSGTEVLHAYAPNLSALMDDLLFLSPELNGYQDRIGLRESDDSPGGQSYRFLQETVIEAPIKYCTHAMVALDRRLSKNDPNGALLGEYHTLLVDEAHTFEANVSNVFGRGVSVHSLRAQVRKAGYGTAAGRQRVIDACTNIINKGSELRTTFGQDELFVLPKDWQENTKKVQDLRHIGLFKAFHALEDSLQKISRSKKELLPPWVYEARAALRSCPPAAKDPREPDEFMLDSDTPLAKNWAALMLNISPQRGYLSMSVGSVSVRKVLENIWEGADQGVALISATLLLPNGMGGLSGRYAEAILGLTDKPQLAQRVVECRPVIPDWVTSPVSLYYPDPQLTPELAEVLSPPAFEKDTLVEDEQANETWLDAVAEQITSIVLSATGGTLVLLSAYDRQEDLLSRLEKQGFGNRLVRQQRGGVPYSANQFRALARAGEKPIWLAVGAPAWMGLDLNDKDIPGLLSDLVIPRLPFGIAQGITSRWRAKTGAGKAIGYPPFVAETAFSFRQGIGRLVRHSQVKSKRLWILDSRPWLAQQSGSRRQKSVYSIFRAILDPYKLKKLSA